MDIAIVITSDRSAQGLREDLTGPRLRSAVEAGGWTCLGVDILPDDRAVIARRLEELCTCADVVLTSGGTGFAERDVTPEATLDVIERQTPGISEAIRADGMTKTPHAMLSRAVSGIRGRCLIINLPGSPKGALEGFEVVKGALEHASALLKGLKPDK